MYLRATFMKDDVKEIRLTIFMHSYLFVYLFFALKSSHWFNPLKWNLSSPWLCLSKDSDCSNVRCNVNFQVFAHSIVVFTVE